ncbi:unnamed protein product [Periconia digitata]|uniref:Uncharacterized protein n=1 Tax=Periconia digitata TaxID=1303443 RepID=A0A9W4U0D0_9PLEO|nr:unnamed protein product [Periconia digitata]
MTTRKRVCCSFFFHAVGKPRSSRFASHPSLIFPLPEWQMGWIHSSGTPQTMSESNSHCTMISYITPLPKSAPMKYFPDPICFYLNMFSFDAAIYFLPRSMAHGSRTQH